jgi:glycosyltransferase involved in cell wall biosynthesis
VGIGWLDKLFLPLLGTMLAKRLHKRKEYDIIHSVQASYGGIAAYFFKKKFPGVPLVLNLQEGKELSKQWFAVSFWRSRIIKTADKIVVISKYLRDFIKKQGINMDKVVLVPNGVDLKKFSKDFSYGELENLREQLGIKPYHKILVTVSRLEKKNNVGGIIEAVKILDNKDIKLLIIGDGSLKKHLETKVESFDIRDNVKFLRTIDHKDLPRYLSIADVFVRPSFSEGLGTAFLEAMATGCPVIATEVGGIPDFLKDFRTGLFCTTEPKSIAQKASLLLGDRDLRNKLLANAYKLVEQHYTWEIITEKYKEIFKSLKK